MATKIVTDPTILGGKPVVRGARISVEPILELIASGASVDDIARTYPALAREDVMAAILFAARYLRGASWTWHSGSPAFFRSGLQGYGAFSSSLHAAEGRPEPSALAASFYSRVFASE